ncbi:hypothetical protein Tco_0951939 [Tanacetum coccineum]|uniref:Uncharacterized protein n=1 Tax=Tanacetum coccineum TaxID=301880 RepID=A0ABQ5E2C2_9ASTR
MPQPMQNLEDSSDPTTAFNMALALMAKAFTLNDTTPTNNNQRSSSNPSNIQITQPRMNIDQDRHMLMVEDNVGNHNTGIGNRIEINVNQIRCYTQGEGHYASTSHKAKEKDAALSSDTTTDCYKRMKQGIQLNYRNFDFNCIVPYEEIEKVTANCNLQDNLQQASTSGTQSNKAHVYDSDGSAQVHHYENCYDNDIFNMFTQEEQYTALNSDPIARTTPNTTE